MVKLANSMKSPRIIYGLAMLIIFGIALFLRIYFQYDSVFTDGWVRFHENDPWYHMRQIENLSYHFPHLNSFDPYVAYPGGQNVTSAPFLDILVGFFVWMIGIGSPSPRVIDTVGACFPAIMGALITVPVYFIGKELFNRKAGIIAAALIAILPGQFMWRTLLGFTDHHVAEIFFSASTMMFLIVAMKRAREKELSVDSLKKKDWKAIGKPFLYSLLCGISLGCYLLSWTGGAFLVFILVAFVVIQFIIDHLRKQSTDYLGIVPVISFIIAILMVAPVSSRYQYSNLQVASLLIGIIGFLAFGLLSYLMATKKIKEYFYPMTLVVLGGIGIAILYVADPSLFKSILNKFNVFTPTGGYLTVAEMKGVAQSSGWQIFITAFYLIFTFAVVISHRFVKEKNTDRMLLIFWCATIVMATLAIGWGKGLSLSTIWDQYGICFYLALISVVLIAYLVAKEGGAGKTLLLVWSLIIIIATLGQNRFAYYLAINVALLTGYFSWRILEFAGVGEISIGKKETEKIGKEISKEKQVGKVKLTKKERRKQARAGWERQKALTTQYKGSKYAYAVIAIVVIFFLAFFPNIGTALERARGQTGATDDWHESLNWMRNNTPDPFQDPDFYYELYQKPAAGQTFEYPESAYGVMSWWDYGYWITYIAHRIPNASPSGQLRAVEAGSFFTAQDEATAIEILNNLGSKYVVIDYAMATSKYYAMALWAGRSQSEFFGIYYVGDGTGALSPVQLYYPEYYRSMCVRLYIFSGEVWDPDEWITNNTDSKIQVISYVERTDLKGNKYREITDVKQFDTYATAKAFVDAEPDYIIVGTNPYISPVPLEELQHFELIHQSPSSAATRGNEKISVVEIFEYTP